jgi:hypothetical protein
MGYLFKPHGFFDVCIWNSSMGIILEMGGVWEGNVWEVGTTV